MTTFNWQQVEDTAYQHIIRSVLDVKNQHPNETIYSAIFHCFYGDGEDIYWASLSVGTEELLARTVVRYQQDFDEPAEKLSQALRWSGADLLEYGYDPNDDENDMAEAVAEFALAQSDDGDDEELWEQIYQEFLACFPRACQRARQYLIENNVVHEDFIAIAYDEPMDLLRASLTHEQFIKHFSHLL